MAGGTLMATQIYKVQDPTGVIREIEGPAGASDADVIAQAQRLFAAPAQEQLPGPRQPTIGDYARELLGPTVEMLGGAIGAGIGTAAAPGFGTLAGAGLGYGIARQALERFDVARGAKAPPQLGQQFVTAAGDVVQGATSEAAGRVIGQGLKAGVEAVKQIPETRAAKLVTNALAKDKIPVDDAVNALLKAPPGVTAGEALAAAGLEGQTTQALLSRSISRDPAYVGRLLRAREAEQLSQLGALAGGTSQTAARATREQAVRNLSQLTEPQKQAALARANLGATQLDMAATAAAARQQAGEAVEGVRRYTRVATETAPRVQARLSAEQFPGQPRVPIRATYMGEVVQMADDAAEKLAKGSLTAGDVARMNEAAIKTQQAYGLNPLTPASVKAQIRARLNDPELAANKPMEIAFREVDEAIDNWTRPNGVIAAGALDAIRKNAVTSVALQLAKDNPTLQRKIASKLTASLTPAIGDAIEAAGGKGYKQYLADYAKARQVINQKKLGAEAMAMLRKPEGRKAFVELVEGNDEETVERIFGPGSYDIAKELSADVLATFKNISAVERASMTAAKQASEGGEALRKLLSDNLPVYRLPSFFSVKTTITNDALDKLQSKIGRRTMEILTKGAESGRSLDDLLQGLSVAERARLERLFRETGEAASLRLGKAATPESMFPLTSAPASSLLGTAATLQTLPEVRRTTEREINFLRSRSENANALAR